MRKKSLHIVQTSGELSHTDASDWLNQWTNPSDSLLQLLLLLPPPLGTQVLDDGLDVFTWFLPQEEEEEKKNQHLDNEVLR